MAGTIHLQVPSFGFAKEAEDDHKTSGKDCKPSPRYPDFKHRVTRQPLWMDSQDTPFWVIEELRSRGFIVDPCDGAALSSKSQIDGFVASLRTCTRNKDLITGTRIHDDLVQRGLLEKCSHALVIMYVKCGELGKAKELLDMHKSSDVVTWTALIAGYAREGHGQNALDCFEQMQHEGILPDAVTYLCILNACATIRAADKGKQIHEEIARQGLLQNKIELGNALVDMYAKCGAVSKARQVLDGLPSRNVVSWNALIAGYAQGHADQALNCFEEMQREGILPNAVTYSCILKACATIRAADKGKQIHEEIARQGLLQNDIVLGGALVDMYAKCGAVSKAQQVLDGLPYRNVISWSALIAGYAQEGHAEQALNCFKEMQREGILPNAVTYACILKACATIGAADEGKQIHEKIARQGLLQNDLVLGNALVDMYAKCGDVSKARQVLDGLPSRDVVSWNALIAGYAQEGHAEQALNCFEEMQREGFLPDIVSWNALIAGYAQEGHAVQALNCFEEMQHAGILPDAVTCACVLSACSHRGLVEEGQSLFVNMSTKYALNPSLECYTCMVDLFGRAGHLEKAVRLIQDMPSSDLHLFLSMSFLLEIQSMHKVI